MKKTIVFCIAFFLVFLCSCNTGYREIDRGYLVSAIGFDKQETTIQIYVEALSSSDVEQGSDRRVVLTGQGDTFDQAFKSLNLQLVKPLYFEQTGSAVFNPLLLSGGIEFLQSIPNIHPGVFVVQTDNVKALFESETPGGMLGYDIIGLLKTHSKKLALSSQLFKVRNDKALVLKINFDKEKLNLIVTGENYAAK